jgi:transposase-like protein
MKQRKLYTSEFKQEAVRLIEQPGANVQGIAKDLGACMPGEKQPKPREG